MPRALILCTTIVAAFQIHLAAASPNVEDAPVSPGVAAIAARLGLDAAHNPALFLSEITRLLYTSPDGRSTPRALRMARVADPGAVAPHAGGSDNVILRVPVPLPAQVWSRAVFHRTVSAADLIDAIVAERHAALVAYGLTGLDDETLAFVAEHPSLLTFLNERAAGPFAAFGEAFRVSGGRVAVPGGAAAVPLWEAVVHERVSAPEPFARALFGELEGRLAYLYSVVGSADPPAAAFALGFWIADEHLRSERFARLADACVTNYHEWHVDVLPFSRPLSDLAVVLLRLRVLPTGAPAAPASRAFWAAAFDVGEGFGDASGPPTSAGHGSIDAAWLVGATGATEMYSRGDRLDQFAFGQRVFADVPDAAAAEAIDAVKAFTLNRMLLLTLERVGVRRPAVYTAAVRQASAVTTVDQDGRFWTIAQFQGVLALIARMHRTGTIDDARAERLVSSLIAVPLDRGGYHGRIVEWLITELAVMLPPGDSWEERIAAGLAGPPPSAGGPRLDWEGQSYHVDLSFAERRRLEAIRAKQGGHTVDLAVDLQAEARTIRETAASANAAGTAAAAMRAMAIEHEALLRRPPVNLLPPGVEPPPDGYQWLSKAADDAAKLSKTGGEPRRLGRVGISMSSLADIVLGNALLSIAYAVDLGDAEGAALLGTNVALRHDFGLARRDRTMRLKMPWSLPRQDFMPGVPWHISGSLLGLDIALAPLALRRVTLEDLPDAPRLASIEREAFAVSVSLMEPARLTEGDRDAIANAIGRGRQQLQGIAAGREAIAAVENTLMLDGHRRRSVEWTQEHDPPALAAQFSLAELFTLGGGAPGADVNAWGASGVNAWGCACTRFPPTYAWRILAGRAQVPYVANTLTELNLSLILMMRDMRVPASLTRAVLAAATRDFIDDSSPTDSNDWWSLARTAQQVRRQRVEDYVAATAAVDGPLVPDQADAAPQP